jgi:cell wall-associated NlpC family hydrolase
MPAMKHQLAFHPLPTLAVLLVVTWTGATLAAEPADMLAPLPSSDGATTAADRPLLQGFGPSVAATASNFGGSLAGTVRSTFNGTAAIAGSMSQIVGETVRSTVTGTAAVAGGVTQVVTSTVKNTVVGTANVAGLVGNAVTDTVRNTVTGSFNAAGAIGNVVADTFSSTVTGTVNVAGTMTSVVADTVGGGVRSLVAAPKRMLDYAESLIGTPYKWGGTSVINGLDCSGFVQEVVRTATGKLLPRTAKEMSAAGRRVSYGDLKPGDLVFFNTRRRPYSHVGIYLGDGEFVHGASGKKSGKQVRVDKLDSNYYRTRYNGARRIQLPPGAYNDGNMNFGSLLPKSASQSFAPR